MNYFDLIFAIPLLWGAYKGFSKGLIISIASLIALLLGIYGSIRFSGYTREFVNQHFEVTDNYIPLIAFAITFLGIVIGIHFLAKLLNKLVDAIALGWLNTIAGIVFGLLKAAFIISIFIFIFEKIDRSEHFISKSIKEESLLYDPIRTLAPALFPSLKKFELEPSIPTPDLTNFSV